MFTGNRKLGIVLGLPDMGSLFELSDTIETEFNKISTSGVNSLSQTGEFNVLNQLSTSSIAEIDWPKPCEYFMPMILASEFPTTLNNSVRDENDLILPAQQSSDAIGISGLFSKLSNLPISGSTIYNLFDKPYRYTILARSGNGNTTNTFGYFSEIFYDPFGTSFETQTPIVSVIGQSGRFQFVRALEGFEYETQYTRNLSSGWLTTGVNYSTAPNQSGVSIGFLRVEFYIPLSTLAGGNLFFRIRAVPLVDRGGSDFLFVSSGQDQNLYMINYGSNTNIIIVNASGFSNGSTSQYQNLVWKC
jgi:hypothetical protein